MKSSRNAALIQIILPLQFLQRAQLSDGFSDLRAQRQDGRRADGKLIDADGQEGGQQAGVCTELAADTDPDTVLMCGIRGHLQGTKDCRMMRVEELAKVVRLTVAGQRVLGQIVGTDGEEVDFFGQVGGHEDGGRRLDHDTDLGIRIEGDALFLQLFHDSCAGTFAFAHFPD